LVGGAKNVAESAVKVEVMTSILKKGFPVKADGMKNVMNVVSVSFFCNYKKYFLFYI
jgi:hypothetical protein